ncbi:HEPN domain-containing protein [Alteromonas macleodii]|uniref:HEPN domain-containing protein n=1 Tax=Alteromonas macleodii TaxID=28108 RepID=UPI00313ECBCF
MLFTVIENALKTCAKHLKALDPTNNDNGEVESYLVGGLVVLIVSEYEDHLESVFVRRAEKCGDACAINFIRNTLSQKFRSPDLSKITTTLKNFDVELNKEFRSDIQDSPEMAAWDSLMKARHAVVHKKGSLKLTFRDLMDNYEKTKKVIIAVENTLGVGNTTP